MSDWLCGDELAPSTAGALAPLFSAAARGELVMPFCDACGAVLELEQAVCDGCGGGARWQAVERRGTVHASTLVHRLEPGLLRATAPYPVLDAILKGLIERDLSAEELAAEGQDFATVQRVWRLLEGAEYKRRQAPPGVKITSRLISKERRYPIVNGFRG